MKSFKQYFISEDTQSEQYFENRIRDIITAEPYKFTWLGIDKHSADFKSQHGSVVAFRNIPQKYHDSLHSNFKICINLQKHINMEIPMPMTDMNIDIFPFRFTTVTVIPFKEEDTSEYNFTVLEPKPVSNFRKFDTSIYFEIYNYYISLEGISNKERHVRTVDKFLSFWRSRWNMLEYARYTDDQEATFLQKKREVFGDESLSTDDWIDMGMSNI